MKRCFFDLFLSNRPRILLGMVETRSVNVKDIHPQTQTHRATGIYCMPWNRNPKVTGLRTVPVVGPDSGETWSNIL